MFKIISAVLFCLIGFCHSIKFSDDTRKVSIYINNGEYTVTGGILDDSKADVIGYFQDGMNTTGWGILEIKIIVQSDSLLRNVNDTQRGYAAGIAEGYLTSDRLYQMYKNTVVTETWDYTNGPSKKLEKFLNEQQEWMIQMINNNTDDPLWKYVAILRQQMNGLQYGYNLTASKYGVPTFPANNSWPFEFLTLDGDLPNLEYVVNKLHDPNYDSNNNNNNKKHYWGRQASHCSALIKITPEYDDIFIGHSTWYIYQAMNRIYKYYHFNFSSFNNNELATYSLSFSSYPGYLISVDDFYIADSGLAMLQTTNNVPNHTLYDYVIPQTLLSWYRVRAAMALAKTGEEWYYYIKGYNSGTYNNQYMVIDHKNFQIGQPLPNNFLWVVEQIPTLVLGYDYTQILKRGYFGSYNVPAIEEIYNKSGYPSFVDKTNVANSYDLAPRARIFRRDSNNIENIVEFNKLMRYNNYLYDKIENNNPMWAVCSRGDIPVNDTSIGQPFGCIDTKGSNLTMIQNLQALIKNGPSNDNLPSFTWNQVPFKHVPHYGINETMNYPWVFVSPQLRA